MADHLAEQILAKVVLILTNNHAPVYPTDANDQVFRNRTIVISESMTFPAINILIGRDTPLETKSGYANLNFVDSELELFIDLCISSIAQDVDTKLNQLRKQIHQTLVAGGVTNLGMPANVFVIFPGECEEPVVHTESAKQIVTMRIVWRVRYRTKLTDPTQ